MSSQSWEQLINPVAVADGTALASSTTLTDVSMAPQTTIPANYLQPGSMLRVTARAKFSNTSTPTLLLGLYYGGVAGTKLCAIGATTTTTGATNWPIQIEALINVRTIGSSGTCYATGFVDLGTSLTAVTRIPMDASAVAAATIDTTTAKTLTLGAQWGTNNASNTLTVVQWAVESLN